jgi:hypothetical protein
MIHSIAVNSLWRGKQTPIEVIVTHVTIREVTYISVDRTVSATVAQSQFVRDFQPVRKKRRR